MENIKVAKKLTKNSIMLIIGQILTKIIGLAFIVILARTLGINDFGKYSFILNTVLLVSVFVNFGLDTLLVREIATDKTNLSNYFGNIIWIKILISAVLISIIYIIINVTNLLNDPVKSYGLMLFSFIIFFTTLNTTFWTIGDANQEMQYHSILSILWSILRFAFGLIVILINNNLISLLRILLLSEIIIAIISFFVITRKFGTPKLFPDKKTIIYLLKMTLPLGLIEGFTVLYTRTDTILLLIFKGDSAVGLYNASYNLILPILIIPGSIVSSTYPLFSKYFSELKYTQITKIFDFIVKLMLIIGLPMAFCTTLLSKDIILLIYGNKYVLSMYSLQILIWALAVMFINALLGSSLISFKLEKQLTKIVGITALINIILNLLFIPALSYSGAALSKLFSEIIALILCIILLPKAIHPTSIIKLIQKPLIASLIISAFILLTPNISLIIKILLSIIIYLAILMIIKIFNNDEIRLLKQLLKIPEHESRLDNWDNFWDKNKPVYVNKKIIDVINNVFDNNILNKKILEIGAGSGNDSIYLGKNNAKVTALDYSEKSIKTIQENCINQNITIDIVKSDATETPFVDATFDLVFSQGVIEHFKDPTKLIQEQNRILKKGAYILVDVPQKYNLYTLNKKLAIWLRKWAFGWETEYSIKELETLLKNNGFEIVTEFCHDYYPAFLKKLRYLEPRIKKYFPLIPVPSQIWKLYNTFWEKIEQSKFGLYFLMNIGIVAKKL